MNAGEALSPERQFLLNDLASVASNGLRETDIPGLVMAGHYAICLPNTDQPGANIVLERVIEILQREGLHAGIVTFPDDGTDGAILLEAGLTAALSS